MIGSGATEELVLVDKDNHECYLLVDETNRHNRPLPEYTKITQLCNPNLRMFIDMMHTNQLDVQVKYIFLLARKLSPPPVSEDSLEIPPEESVLANIETYRTQLTRMLEHIEENEVSIDGKFMGYMGFLKIRGDRVVQYNHYPTFLPQMPPNCLILRKLLEFYLNIYPLRVERRKDIKDYVAERKELFIGMDSQFKVVTDVVLVPLVMMNDNLHALDVNIPVEISPFGIDIGDQHLNQYLSMEVKDVVGQPPKLCMSEFSIKELRGILMLVLEICFDRVTCPKIVEFGNQIYSLVANGLTISRKKIEVLTMAYELPATPLALDIIEVIIDPSISEDDFSQRVRKMIEVVRTHEQGQ